MDRSSLLHLIHEQQLDPENTGFIGVDTFAGLVHSHELPLDPAKLDMLVALAQSNERGQVCYQELVDLIGSRRSGSFKRAIANGQRALPRDGLLDEPGLGFYKRFVRYVAYEILPCEVDRRWYFSRHRSCPPPVFMASVTLAQIVVFLCYGARLNKWVLQTYHPEYMKSPLVYHPGHRARAWCFLTYMFMHVGLPDRVHHRHAGPRGGGLRRGLRPVLGAPGQRRHELGWDAVSLQAAADGAGPGVHELGGGPRRVAALLAAAARLGPAAQLHGAPGGRRGGREHGPHHPTQLRGAPAGPVRLVGGPAGLRHLPALRRLLERLCLRPAGRPRPPAALTASWAQGRPCPRPAPGSAVRAFCRVNKYFTRHQVAVRGLEASLPPASRGPCGALPSTKGLGCGPRGQAVGVLAHEFGLHAVGEGARLGPVRHGVPPPMPRGRRRRGRSHLCGRCLTGRTGCPGGCGS
ncbi:rhomboid-related protein 1 isoform X1 [Oryctolagus cuniculus]|uniref:rhomboid-related protein 1 isoform X1 n=1 Tax=Oryctolagus cuniculus TaxID=9986 RepID=UPI003879942E